MTREALAELLNRFPEVRWDRMAFGEWPLDDVGLADGCVFGWIDREDGRSDFMLVEWKGDAAGFTTSSGWYSAEFSIRMHGADAAHSDCERVEHVLGELVPGAIRLASDFTIKQSFGEPQPPRDPRKRSGEVRLPGGLLTRVWRESFGYWWAELWRPRIDSDPPVLFRAPTPAPPQPLPVDGFVRVGLALKKTRRKARKETVRMAGRYAAGLHPQHDRTPVEEASYA